MTDDRSPSPAESHTATPDPVVTILFDGGCPLCAREVSHYRRLHAQRTIAWVDISLEPDLVQRFAVQPAAAMARLHVRDTHGRWVTGAYAFAVLWAQLPRYRMLASVLGSLRLLPVIDRAYGHFARWRLRRRCAAGSCAPDRRQRRTSSDQQVSGGVE